MLQQDYTEKERKLFTGRDSSIKHIADSISKNSCSAVLAPAGLGRTSLLRHIAAENGYLYIDLRKLSLTPESFAVDFIGSLCFLNFAGTPSEIKDYQTIGQLKDLKLGKKCGEMIGTVENELQKIKPDQQLLLKTAFAFAEELSTQGENKKVIILNNFEELLKLNNFSQVKDVMPLFFGTTGKNMNCRFIVASSAVQAMEDVLKQHTKEVFVLPPLSLKETSGLFVKLCGKTDERILREVHALSAGIPLVVKSVAERFRDERTSDTQKDVKLVRHILISDLVTTTSSSYSYCSRLFTDSLNRARGESLLKAILKVVSQNEPLRLTEVARRIYRSGPVTKSLLERLVEVDLVVRKDCTFDFANPVLKLWCRLMFSGVEFSETPDEKTMSGFGGLL